MVQKKLFAGLSLLISVGGCSSTPPTLDLKSDHPNATSLTQEAAKTRFNQISNVSYGLSFNLNGDSSDFSGKTVIHFGLKPNAKSVNPNLLIDLEGGQINSLIVNGKPIQKPYSQYFDGHHIKLKISELNSGINQVEVSFVHSYSHDGTGLYRFQDPADQKVYLYSDFEPFQAHRMFPCFDQPDLKATFQVEVTAPNDWVVISNTLENSTVPIDNQKKWTFPISSKFSTYLFALHAGPYAIWKSQANEIPLRLFARRSLAHYVDHQEWLEVTKNGLEFYGTQFGYPYPFKKYDQILVPDFNAGAMENVGAVTFSENFVYRTTVTEDRRRRRADTILHEMAHMWFGDLVTMKWWNGLWLNESFATFIAAWAVDQSTKFKGSWQNFFTQDKQWAYWEDQLVTTHPIEGPVPDTESATSIFDGITYGKGASSLKQLKFFLGEDDFREGLQRYFQKYAYQNSTLENFFSMLAQASSQNLSNWQNSCFKLQV